MLCYMKFFLCMLRKYNRPVYYCSLIQPTQSLLQTWTNYCEKKLHCVFILWSRHAFCEKENVWIFLIVAAFVQLVLYIVDVGFG